MTKFRRQLLSRTKSELADNTGTPRSGKALLLKKILAFKKDEGPLSPDAADDDGEKDDEDGGSGGGAGGELGLLERRIAKLETLSARRHAETMSVLHKLANA